MRVSWTFLWTLYHAIATCRNAIEQRRSYFKWEVANILPNCKIPLLNWRSSYLANSNRWPLKSTLIFWDRSKFSIFFVVLTVTPLFSLKNSRVIMWVNYWVQNLWILWVCTHTSLTIPYESCAKLFFLYFQWVISTCVSIMTFQNGKLLLVN